MRAAFIGIAAIAAIAATGCGNPILFAELDEPSICKTVPNVVFDPSVPGTDLRKDFPLSLKDFLPLFTYEGASTTIQGFEAILQSFDPAVEAKNPTLRATVPAAKLGIILYF